MSQFLRIPWLFGPSASSTARGALTALLSLDQSAQNKIRDAITQVGLPFSRKKLTDRARQLSEELKVLDTDTLFTIMDALTDLVGMPPQLLPEVLSEMFKDTGVPFSNLELLVKAITSDPDIVRQRAIQEFTQRSLPNFRGVEYVCTIRTRFDKDFRYNEDNIESYNPKVVDRHAALVLKIELDDPRRSISFQLDQERLDRLISELIAAQRQLKVAADELVGSRNEKTDAK